MLTLRQSHHRISSMVSAKHSGTLCSAAALSSQIVNAYHCGEPSPCDWLDLSAASYMADVIADQLRGDTMYRESRPNTLSTECPITDVFWNNEEIGIISYEDVESLVIEMNLLFSSLSIRAYLYHNEADGLLYLEGQTEYGMSTLRLEQNCVEPILFDLSTPMIVGTPFEEGASEAVSMIAHTAQMLSNKCAPSKYQGNKSRVNTIGLPGEMVEVLGRNYTDHNAILVDRHNQFDYLFPIQL